MKYDRWWGRRRDLYAVYIHCAVNPSIFLSFSLVALVQQMFLFEFCLPYTHPSTAIVVVVVVVLLWFQRTKRAQTKTEKTKRASLVCFVLRTSRSIFRNTHTHREANTQVRRCVVLFDTAQLLAQILFCFCFFVKFYLLRCWHDVHTDSRNSFLTHTAGPRKNRFL